jgi:hypothetical protein
MFRGDFLVVSPGTGPMAPTLRESELEVRVPDADILEPLVVAEKLAERRREVLVGSEHRN